MDIFFYYELIILKPLTFCVAVTEFTRVGLGVNISSKFSINSEAFASELIENLEEMFPKYYIHSNIFGMFKY